MSFYIDPFNRLFLHVIQRHTVISHILEINSFQVYATDVAIVHGAIINDPIRVSVTTVNCVALGTSADAFPQGCSVPVGISKLFRI